MDLRANTKERESRGDAEGVMPKGEGCQGEGKSVHAATTREKETKGRRKDEKSRPPPKAFLTRPQKFR